MPSPVDGLITVDLDVALDRLRAGGLVAIPTETVYGLAADAEQPDAVGRIFDVKGRPRDHPLIVHVAGAEAMDGWASSIPDAARTLGQICWPGPLTMLLRRGDRATDVVTGGRPTVGLRAPAHPLAHELLVRFGGGLAAPSANRFGKVSPTSAEHVLRDLAEFLVPGRDAILDGGPSLVGVESTIVDLTVAPPQVLRAGAIGADEIGRLLETPIAEAAGPSRASGMLEAHYEPDCLVVLAESAAAGAERVRAASDDGRRADLLDRTDDLVLAAQQLYADLRAADDRGLDELVVVLPRATGLGVVIRDRLMKAVAGGARRRSNRAD